MRKTKTRSDIRNSWRHSLVTQELQINRCISINFAWIYKNSYVRRRKNMGLVNSIKDPTWSDERQASYTIMALYHSMHGIITTQIITYSKPAILWLIIIQFWHKLIATSQVYFKVYKVKQKFFVYINIFVQLIINTTMNFIQKLVSTIRCSQ